MEGRVRKCPSEEVMLRQSHWEEASPRVGNPSPLGGSEHTEVAEEIGSGSDQAVAGRRERNRR